jgi:tRNA threonylcarbamoyl adenosine modification protein YjeE
MVAFGQSLGRALRPFQVIALNGDLGAGKTTMAKGMIGAITGVSSFEVTSPTFQYVQIYTAENRTVAHFDLWRLRSIDEFVDLGLEEYLSNTVAIIEWPDRIAALLPQDTLRVDVSIVPEGRRVTIKTGCKECP